MPPQNRTRLTLELDVDADPIAGTAYDATGASELFVGWIALTRAVELALKRASSSEPHGRRRRAANPNATAKEAT